MHMPPWTGGANGSSLYKDVQQTGGLDICRLTYPCALSKGAEPGERCNDLLLVSFFFCTERVAMQQKQCKALLTRRSARSACYQ